MACATPVAARAGELVTTEQLKDAWLKKRSIVFGDPTFAQVELPHQRTYSPLGFPVLLCSNSEEVHASARESWDLFELLFDPEVMRVNVVVAEGTSCLVPPTPACRMREHLITNIANAENFAVVDLERGSAFVTVTEAALQNREYFRYFFLESSAMALIANRHATGIHAACVAWNGTGVLLCGDSGAGKSTLAYACARAGWTYVTDDGSYLALGREDKLVVGNCSHVRFRPDAARFFSELQGRTPMIRAGGGKPSVELPFIGQSACVSQSARVGPVVFLRRGEFVQELAAFPIEVARLYFMQRIYCMPYVVQKHTENIEILLRDGVYELRYHDLNWAVERLSKLAAEGC